MTPPLPLRRRRRRPQPPAAPDASLEPPEDRADRPVLDAVRPVSSLALSVGAVLNKFHLLRQPSDAAFATAAPGRQRRLIWRGLSTNSEQTACAVLQSGQAYPPALIANVLATSPGYSVPYLIAMQPTASEAALTLRHLHAIHPAFEGVADAMVRIGLYTLRSQSLTPPDRVGVSTLSLEACLRLGDTNTTGRRGFAALTHEDLLPAEAFATLAQQPACWMSNDGADRMLRHPQMTSAIFLSLVERATARQGWIDGVRLMYRAAVCRPDLLRDAEAQRYVKIYAGQSASRRLFYESPDRELAVTAWLQALDRSVETAFHELADLPPAVLAAVPLSQHDLGCVLATPGTDARMRQGAIAALGALAALPDIDARDAVRGEPTVYTDGLDVEVPPQYAAHDQRIAKWLAMQDHEVKRALLRAHEVRRHRRARAKAVTRRPPRP